MDVILKLAALWASALLGDVIPFKGKLKTPLIILLVLIVIGGSYQIVNDDNKQKDLDRQSEVRDSLAAARYEVLKSFTDSLKARHDTLLKSLVLLGVKVDSATHKATYDNRRFDGGEYDIDIQEAKDFNIGPNYR